jgi:hypothetical protein
MVGYFLGHCYLIGILHWGYFLNWFNNRFELGDWHNIVEPFLVFLTNAVRSGQLPLQGDSPLFDSWQVSCLPEQPSFSSDSAPKIY